MANYATLGQNLGDTFMVKIQELIDLQYKKKLSETLYEVDASKNDCKVSNLSKRTISMLWNG